MQLLLGWTNGLLLSTTGWYQLLLGWTQLLTRVVVGTFCGCAAHDVGDSREGCRRTIPMRSVIFELQRHPWVGIR